MDNAARIEVFSLSRQDYGKNPRTVRETDHYQKEYISQFVSKWDELIDWEARSKSEGNFFIDLLRSQNVSKVLDVATGTGYHSVKLAQNGFDVTSVDGSDEMLIKAFNNAKKRNIILKTVHSDWRYLSRNLESRFDAVICLGNSFTHLFSEKDRRRSLAEFYSMLNHDGILIIDQRNYDAILDLGFNSKHTTYYCGKNVTAEPEYVDEGLARFCYKFKNNEKYYLNMYPLRLAYMTKLIKEAGFQTVKTYGDFHEKFNKEKPDFLIHVAKKQFEK